MQRDAPSPATAAEVAGWFSIRRGARPSEIGCARIADYINGRLQFRGEAPLDTARHTMFGIADADALRQAIATVRDKAGQELDLWGTYVECDADHPGAEKGEDGIFVAQIDPRRAGLFGELAMLLDWIAGENFTTPTYPSQFHDAIKTLTIVGNKALGDVGRAVRSVRHDSPLAGFVSKALARLGHAIEPGGAASVIERHNFLQIGNASERSKGEA